MNIREPAVAGSFYPADRHGVNELIRRISSKELPEINTGLARREIIGAIVPHAGYIYSGYEAIHVFEILHLSSRIFDTIIIINPNHHGYGPPMATDENTQWKTPLGLVQVDFEMADALEIPRSSDSHRFEHSGEVMLPFLQFFLGYDFKIVPISMLRQDHEQAVQLSEKISRANVILKKRILVLASSDFSHFVSPEVGARTDRIIIDAILSMNAQSVYREIRETQASVCGYGPIMTLIDYANRNFSKPCCKLLKFGNSGKTDPSDRVVDYASFLFFLE
jgi:AmmeMemoRadiSam system protein B